MQSRSHHSLSPHASVSTRRMAPSLAAFGRWLALMLVAGLTLAAQAQTTATATAAVVNGFVVVYTVTAGGSGYTEPPVVTVLGGGGTGATAVAQVANGVVTQISVVATDGGYASPPQVVISVPPQTTATATATVSYGFVVAYTVTAGGSGYTEPPVVTVLGDGAGGQRCGDAHQPRVSRQWVHQPAGGRHLRSGGGANGVDPSNDSTGDNLRVTGRYQPDREGELAGGREGVGSAGNGGAHQRRTRMV